MLVEKTGSNRKGMKKNYNNIYPVGLALLPIINSDMFSVPESLSGLNKMIFSILIITVL